jgi:hypothetical protein
MKAEFNKWYDQCFDQLMAEYNGNAAKSGLIRALYPALEIAALKYYDGKKRSLKERLKWNYFLLLKKDETYTLTAKDEPNPDVIFWPSQPKHYVLQLPVYKRLQALKIKAAFISNTISLQEDFKKDGVNYLKVTTKSAAKSRIAIWRENLEIIKRSKAFAPFKTDKYTIHFSEVIADALTYRMPCDKSVAMFNELVKVAKPKVMFLGYAFSTVSMSLDKICAEKGITTTSLQMGRMNYYFFKYSFLRVFYAYGAEVAENIKSIKKEVDCVGVGSIKMEITATSPDREYVDGMVADIRKTYKYLGLVSFSGPGLSVSVKNHQQNLAILKQMIEEHPEVYFVIKFHGKDNLKYYTDFQGLANHIIIDQTHKVYQFDIMHLIKNCDFMISGASTTIIEATYWDKPVLSVDALHELDAIALVNEPFLYRCHSFDDAQKALNSIQSKDDVLQSKMKHSTVYADKTFIRGEIQPTELVALDVQKRLKPTF